MAVLTRQSMASLPPVDLAGQDHTKSLDAFGAVLVVVTAISMILRVASRKIMKLSLERDDWTFLAGSTLAEGEFIVSLIYTVRAGLGKHWALLTPGQQRLFPKLNYAFNILNLACYPIIKLSILLLYLRIFEHYRQFRRLCWAGIVVISAMCVANTLVACFACTPVRSFYDFSVPGRCIDSVRFYWSTAILNVVTDLYILVLPIPLVWQLQIALKRKIAVSLIFILGGLTFVISILRIIFYFDYNTADPSYSFWRTAYATPGEVGLAVIVASAPTWRPVWTYVRLMTVSFIRRLSSSSDGSNSGSDSARSFNIVLTHEHARKVAITEKTNVNHTVDDHDNQDGTVSEDEHPRTTRIREIPVAASRKTSVTFIGDEAHHV